MIKEGDYFIVTKSADGESVALPVGTKAGLENDKFFTVRTADGFKVPCAVSGKPSEDDPFLQVNSADGERVAVPLGSGINEIELTNYYGYSNNPNIIFNETTEELDGNGIIDSNINENQNGGGLVFYGDTDINNITLPIAGPSSSLIIEFPFLEATLPITNLTNYVNVSSQLEYNIEAITDPFDVSLKPDPPINFLGEIGKINVFDSAIVSPDILTLVLNSDGPMRNIKFNSFTPTIYGIYISSFITTIPTVTNNEITIANYKAKFFKDLGNKVYPTMRWV